MKRLIFALTVAAFVVSVQAGDTKSAASDKEGDSCCSKAKASEPAKSDCCPMMAKQGSASACPYLAKNAAKETKNKSALQSPKALADAKK
jgi:hypothetical protein